MIRLQSSDNEIFEVDRDVIRMSTILSTMLQEPDVDCGDTDESQGSESITVSNVDGSILKRVVEWCDHHKNDAVISDAANGVPNRANDPWDMTFLSIDKEAASALGIKGLLDLTCQKVAAMIKGKTAEEITHVLTIEDNFTPEEEEQIRKEKPWPLD